MTDACRNVCPLAGGCRPGALCERCVDETADPFFEVVDMLAAAVVPSGETTSVRILVAPLHASAMADGLVVRLACVEVPSDVPRIVWPAGLSVNLAGRPLPVPHRTGPVGPRSRDRGIPLPLPAIAGSHALTVHRPCRPADVHAPRYAVVVTLGRERAPEEVLAMMGGKESLQEALDRVSAAVRALTDSGITFTIPLTCPLTRALVDIPARFAHSATTDPFDLASFLECARRTGRWICPLTDTATQVGHLQVDAYTEAVLHDMREEGIDSAEIEVDQEGRWRPAGTRAPFRSVRPPPAHAAWLPVSVPAPDLGWTVDMIRLVSRLADEVMCDGAGPESRFAHAAIRTLRSAPV
eukprot:jgi/Tetstr1/454240/TSEL_041159.t1